MGLVERITEERRRRVEQAWPVGRGVVDIGERVFGHDDDRFSPEEYGDYLVTSNEVFAAVNLRARHMSRLNLKFFKGRDADKVEITRGPAVDLMRHVNPFWTPRRLARMDELAMGLWGETYWAVETRRGVPVELWWLKPSRVAPVPDENNYLSGFLYESQVGGELIPFTPDEIIWFRYPNPLDEFSALSPIAAARLAADTASAMMKSNRNLFVNGLQAGGVITPTSDRMMFSTEQADELEERFAARMRGVDKAHRWAVLRFEAQLKQLSVTPKDAEFVNGLGVSARQVYNAYGVPSPLLNDLEHATLSNMREYKLLLWEDALVPDADFKASEIEEQLLPKFAATRNAPDHAAWDYTQIPALQESASEAWSRERQAIEIGRSTINEIRRRAGEPPVPWGDVWWAPVNKAPVDDAEEPGGPSPEPLEPAAAAGENRTAAAPVFSHWQARQLLDAVPRQFATVNGSAR